MGGGGAGVGNLWELGEEIIYQHLVFSMLLDLRYGR